MVYHGKVKNGVVVFDQQLRLPDGTRVRVEPEAEPKSTTPTNGTSIWDCLDQLAGAARDLPRDLADRHDHYRWERHR